MRKIALITLALLLFCSLAWAGESKAELSGTNTGMEGLYGTYQFKKQIYMNPLSSFLALDGFQEYYTLSADYSMEWKPKYHENIISVGTHG